jgi:hypothetical protein
VLRNNVLYFLIIESMEIYMHNFNKITKVLGATFLLVGTSTAMAETLTVTTAVTVDNTIDFQTDGVSLDFGTIRATVDDSGSECVGIVVSANPAVAETSTLTTDAASACPNAGDAVLQTVGGTVTRPGFTVAGLAAFTVLDLVLPDTSSAGVEMTLNPAPTGAPSLIMYDFSAYQSSGTPALISLSSGAGSITADATGDIAFTVGATLTTDSASSTLEYQNVGYAGSFDVEVTY